MSSAVTALCRGTVEAQRAVDHLLTCQIRTCTPIVMMQKHHTPHARDRAHLSARLHQRP
jgi:hypothetical protein